MRYKKFQFLFVYLLLSVLVSAQAQTLFVRQANGSQRNYDLSNMRKMTYSSGNVTVQMNDNTTQGLPLSNIRYQNFTDLTTGSFTDSRDNYVYQFVHIGDQIWMSENLRYLPSVVGPAIGSTTVPYYYVYGYEGTDVNQAKETTNFNTYGVLYNWPAIMAGSSSSSTNPSNIRGICPDGWHLPSEAEWVELETYLSGNGYNYDETSGGSGDKIAKSMAAENGWRTAGESGTLGSTQYVTQRNYSGFSALPSGNRGHGAPFYGLFGYGFWWSATQNTDNSAIYVGLIYRGSFLYSHNISKEIGFSVRCVKD